MLITRFGKKYKVYMKIMKTEDSTTKFSNLFIKEYTFSTLKSMTLRCIRQDTVYFYISC